MTLLAGSKRAPLFDLSNSGRSVWRSIAVVIVVLTSVVAARAQKYVILPCEVPEELRLDANRHGQATIRYNFLRKDGMDLDKELIKHNDDNGCAANLQNDSAKEIACREPQLKLKAEKAAFDTKRETHKKQLLAEIDAAIAASGIYLQGLRTQLANVPKSNAQWTRDMEEWVALGQAARAQAIAAAWQAGAAPLLARARQATDATAKKKQEGVAAVLEWIDSYGKSTLTNEQMLRAKSQLQTAENWGHVVDVAEFIVNQHGRTILAAANATPTSKGTILEAESQLVIDFLIKLSGGNPAIVAIRNTTQLWIDVGYGWAASLVMRNRITEIADLQEQSYKEVQRIGREYINRFRILPELRATRQAIELKSC